MLVGYARVSSEEQSLSRQIDNLVSVGVDERNIYQEK
jgi:DNA invertase Pin-like site-specific DNA recombinase